jgi:hypothetical protein
LSIEKRRGQTRISNDFEELLAVTPANMPAETAMVLAVFNGCDPAARSRICGRRSTFAAIPTFRLARSSEDNETQAAKFRIGRSCQKARPHL